MTPSPARFPAGTGHTASARAAATHSHRCRRSGACLGPANLAEEAELSHMELDGQEELGRLLNWVSLDAPRGLLVCQNLGLEVSEFIGTILESRVVRVMKDSDGTVFCASANRLVADTGRPGRECCHLRRPGRKLLHALVDSLEGGGERHGVCPHALADGHA